MPQDLTREGRPRYPADYSFVIQFQEATVGDRPGRIEHLASGRAERFQSNVQMMAFVSRVLSALDDAKPPIGTGNPEIPPSGGE
jgi:hypothetical protein